MVSVWASCGVYKRSIRERHRRGNIHLRPYIAGNRLGSSHTPSAWLILVNVLLGLPCKFKPFGRGPLIVALPFAVMGLDAVADRPRQKHPMGFAHEDFGRDFFIAPDGVAEMDGHAEKVARLEGPVKHFLAIG